MRSYVLNPFHASRRFQRTIALPGRPNRLVRFEAGGTVELDDAEAAVMAQEITAGIIGLAGTPFAKPKRTEPPRLHHTEDDRDPETFEFIPTAELSGWQRTLRDMARRAASYY